MVLAQNGQVALNGICPYFTMFPLEFPLRILKSRARRSDLVLDPFCGRGTTNFAARLLGIRSVGVDSSPVAFAIAASKLANVTSEAIITEARSILDSKIKASIPRGQFWSLAYHRDTLDKLCRFRAALLEHCTTPARVALRAIILGALHGPKTKMLQSYFSNQCPRTYAPKPAYATRFWQSQGMKPQSVDVLGVITRRAQRYFCSVPTASGLIRQSDSRVMESLVPENRSKRFDWIITSPPYYGMRTYIPDQWLRNWFIGGPDRVEYSQRYQLTHSAPNEFVHDLKVVWRNAAAFSSANATLVIRFGGIRDRKANPLDLIKSSLSDSGWTVKTVRAAGSAILGKRQADAFLRASSAPRLEYDIWARRSVFG